MCARGVPLRIERESEGKADFVLQSKKKHEPWQLGVCVSGLAERGRASAGRVVRRCGFVSRPTTQQIENRFGIESCALNGAIEWSLTSLETLWTSRFAKNARARPLRAAVSSKTFFIV